MTATTTNGLVYPVGSDPVGDLDTIVQDLAQGVDDKVLASWATYTPTWSSSGTAPNAGATGAVAGRYRQRGRTIDYRIKLTMGGAGFTAGTGNYNLFLPVTPLTSWEDCCVGAAALLDTSAGATAGRYGASVFLSNAATGQIRIALGGSGGGVWTATAPFVPAAGDIVSVSGTYEV